MAGRDRTAAKGDSPSIHQSERKRSSLRRPTLSQTRCGKGKKSTAFRMPGWELALGRKTKLSGGPSAANSSSQRDATSNAPLNELVLVPLFAPACRGRNLGRLQASLLGNTRTTAVK